MKILAIDTSTDTGSIAITDDEDILVESVLNVGRTHSETLIPSFKEMLEKTQLDIKDLDLLALTLGPGSFTGVRIGASTVKGFALALDKPVAGVSTLEALACNFPFSSLPIMPLFDARRGEIYSAMFRWEEGIIKRLGEDRAASLEDAISKIETKTIFAGEGLVKYGQMIKDRLGDIAVFAPRAAWYVRASNVAALGLKRYKVDGGLDIAAFTPSYRRKSEAEIQMEKGLL
ncbi:MAG: tRNA (adenosine(37)-N6)-threonylcarbamoyltransferase complex dimerization subunit type 1 TsaB [bacterium]|nr:tRNA (adenosine(37)-N6)-threonylcarbamoyltransferase complex dimerization subunit type 1 TsaB [bacterium]